MLEKNIPRFPPKVEYSLSEIGDKFDKVLIALGEWGDEYIHFLEEKA